MIYDTIYAHQDRSDDLVAGVKSTAVLFGEQTKPWLVGFGTVMAGSLAAVGVNGDLGLGYEIGAAATMTYIGWQIYSVDLKDGQSCFNAFSATKWGGLMMLGGLLAS
jgi:4-hydroxybenzoate polyprenyltransferase